MTEMGSMRIITGETGGLNVHSEDDGALHAGTFGLEDYVLNVGNKFKAEIQSSNQIKIYDGDAVLQGRHGRISENDFEMVTINNGSQGNNRIDLICIRYSKLSNVENMELAVIEGVESAGTPSVPSHNTGNILTGANGHDYVLYEVQLTGTSITSITPVYKVVTNIDNLQENVSELLDVTSLVNVTSQFRSSTNLIKITKAYKYGKLVMVHGELLPNFAEGWHTNETITSPYPPITSSSFLVGSHNSGDRNTVIRLDYKPNGAIYGTVSAKLTGNNLFQIIYFTA